MENYSTINLSLEFFLVEKHILNKIFIEFYFIFFFTMKLQLLLRGYIPKWNTTKCVDRI